MLVGRNGRGPQPNRRLISWPRWVQAWREDRRQHAGARTEARAHAPVRRGERLLAVACATGGQSLAATDWALYHHAGRAWTRLGWNRWTRFTGTSSGASLLSPVSCPQSRRGPRCAGPRIRGLPTVAVQRVSWSKVVDQRISLNAQAGRG